MVTKAEKAQADMEARLKALEDWRHDRTVADAVRAEQAKHVDARFDALDKKVDDGFGRMDKLVARIAWMVITPLVLGIIAFALKGGLNGIAG